MGIQQLGGLLLGFILTFFGTKNVRNRFWEQLKQGFKSKETLKKEGVDIDKEWELEKEWRAK